jgi:hypothetical protein
MKAKQLYYVLLACCCIAGIALVGMAYAANNVLAGQASKLSTLRAQSGSLSAQQSSLLQDKSDITRYSELNTVAESIVPQDKDQAEAVRQIVDIASANGIQISSITFPSSTLGETATGLPTPNLTQLTPVAGINGVLNLQITITQNASSAVPYTSFLSFLSGLEQNRRTAEVTSISVTPSSNQPNDVSFTLVVNEFIKP